MNITIDKTTPKKKAKHEIDYAILLLFVFALICLGSLVFTAYKIIEIIL